MVIEVTTVGELGEAFRAKDEDFQSELYEWSGDYMRIRARSKAGGLDHAPNVYVSIKFYGMYDDLRDKIRSSESISADEIDEGAVSSPLAYLEKLITQYTKTDDVRFEFKQVEDGGAVTFDGSFERRES